MIPFALKYIMVIITTMVISAIATPLVRFMSLRVGAVDNPNARRINKVPMPSAGGLAIFVAFTISVLWFYQELLPVSITMALTCIISGPWS